MFDKIVVPVDGWRQGAKVAHVADDLAVASKVPVQLVSVAMPDANEMDEREFTMKGIAFDLRADTERDLIVGYGACNRLAEHINRLDHPLVVMSTTAGGRARDMVLGSFTESLLRRTHAPVLIVGPQWSDWEELAAKPVVVCVDGSAHAEQILPLAVEWSDAFGSDLCVVSRQDPPSGDAVAGDDPRTREEATSDLVESGYVKSIADSIGAVDFEVLHSDPPAKAIADEANARGAGLIMMATHGRTGMSRLAMGSVALQTVFRSNCPVLVIRPEALPLEPDEELWTGEAQSLAARKEEPAAHGG